MEIIKKLKKQKQNPSNTGEPTRTMSFQEILESRKKDSSSPNSQKTVTHFVYQRGKNMFLKKISKMYQKHFDDYTKAHKDVKVKEDIRWLKVLQRGGIKQSHEKLGFQTCIKHAKKIVVDDRRPLFNFLTSFVKEISIQLAGMYGGAKERMFCNTEKVIMDFKGLPDLIIDAMVFFYDGMLKVPKELYPVQYFTEEIEKFLVIKNGEDILKLLKAYSNVEMEHKLDRCRLFLHLDSLPFNDTSLVIKNDNEPYIYAIRNLSRLKNTSKCRLHIKVIESTFKLIFSTIESNFSKNKKIHENDLSLIILYIIMHADVHNISAYFNFINTFKEVESPIFDMFNDVMQYIKTIEIYTKREVEGLERKRIEEAEAMKEDADFKKKLKKDAKEYDKMVHSLMGRLGFDGKNGGEKKIQKKKSKSEIDMEQFKTKKLGLRRNDRNLKAKLGLRVIDEKMKNVGEGQIFNPRKKRSNSKSKPIVPPNRALPKPKKKNFKKKKNSSIPNVKKIERPLPERKKSKFEFSGHGSGGFDDFDSVLGNVLDKLDSPVPLTINPNSANSDDGGDKGGLSFGNVGDTDESFMKKFNRRSKSFVGDEEDEEDSDDEVVNKFPTLNKQIEMMEEGGKKKKKDKKKSKKEKKSKKKGLDWPGFENEKPPKVQNKNEKKKKGLFGGFKKKEDVKVLKDRIYFLEKTVVDLKSQIVTMKNESKMLSVEYLKVEKENVSLKKKMKKKGGVVVVEKNDGGEILKLKKIIEKLKSENQNTKSVLGLKIEQMKAINKRLKAKLKKK